MTPPSTSWIAPVVQPALSDNRNIRSDRFDAAFAAAFERGFACGEFRLVASDEKDGVAGGDHQAGRRQPHST
jgi:hypothetical protein